MTSRNAYFSEDVFPIRSREEPRYSKRVLENINENSLDQDKEGEIVPRHSKRARTEKSFDQDFLTYVLEGELQTFNGSELFRESHVERCQ